MIRQMTVYSCQMTSMTLETLLKSEIIDRRTDLIAIARKGIQTKYIAQIQKFTSLSDNEISSILPISLRQLFRYPPDHKHA